MKSFTGQVQRPPSRNLRDRLQQSLPNYLNSDTSRAGRPTAQRGGGSLLPPPSFGKSRQRSG